MAYPQPINFRASLAYVTDGAGEDAEINLSGNANYPRTTAQGNTVGWENGGSSYQTRNRSSSVDRRLAGHHRNDSVANCDYRMDLPAAGNYSVRLATGDIPYSATTTVDLYDGSSSLGSLATGTTSTTGRFKDAANVEHTTANWPANNSPVTKTFSSTIARFRLVSMGAVICHCRLDAEVAATLAPPPFRTQASRLARLLSF